MNTNQARIFNVKTDKFMRITTDDDLIFDEFQLKEIRKGLGRNFEGICVIDDNDDMFIWRKIDNIVKKTTRIDPHSKNPFVYIGDNQEYQGNGHFSKQTSYNNKIEIITSLKNCKWKEEDSANIAYLFGDFLYYITIPNEYPCILTIKINEDHTSAEYWVSHKSH